MKISLSCGIFYAVIYIGFCQSSSTPESVEDWSNWSAWSKCSRSCGTGLAVQSRRCRNWQGCKGSSVRYNVCTMEQCPSDLDFYASQCSDFDTDGKAWLPAQVAEDSCELRCKLDGRQDSPEVKLRDRVLDGTYCAKATGMCVHGQCQIIGCDLVVGSGKKADNCGVCGGDNSSCVAQNPTWIRHAEKDCSATCGGGYQVLSSVCEDILTKTEMPASACHKFPKPSPAVVSCANIPCPATWKTESWTECSSTCGSGYQLREVYCAESRNSTYIKVSDHTCEEQRPIHWRSCDRNCPTWSVGVWKKCSVTCGDGVESRDVQCRYKDGKLATECAITERPTSTRPCRTWIPCEPTTVPKMTTNEVEDDYSVVISGERLHVEKESVPAEPTYITSDWSSCSVTCGDGIQTRSVKCKIFLEFSRTIPVLPDSQCPGQRPDDSKKCFLHPCQYSFNHPTKKESMGEHVKHHLPSIEDSDTVSDSAEIVQPRNDRAFSEPEKEISGKEIEDKLPEQSKLRSFQDTVADGVLVYNTPNSEERFSSGYAQNYIPKDFVHAKASTSSPYYWKAAGFTECSLECLGGEQESVYHCMRSSDQKQVSSFFCNINERPDAITRMCNDHPCPPRWDPMDYGLCSKTCGGGVKIRKVRCIHEITRSGTGRMIVPDYHCVKPAPESETACNVHACPPRWNTDKWTKCSSACGGGFRRRSVQCVREIPLSELGKSKQEELRDNECDDAKPTSRKSCKLRRCKKFPKGRKRRPTIRALTSQDYTQRVYKKTVTLKIGGRAKVFHGANVKIRCPAKKFDKRRLKWFKNQNRVRKRVGHIRITRKGAIKIRRIQYTDGGFYVCKANEESANLTLIVQPIPSSYGLVEEGNAILPDKTDAKSQIKSEKESYEERVKFAGSILAGNEDLNIYEGTSGPDNKTNIVHSEYPKNNEVQVENNNSSIKNTFRKFVYGHVNHGHQDWSRIALPKTGISLLSATMSQSNQNTTWTDFDDSADVGGSHVYGTVKNQPNNRHNVRMRHGGKPVLGRISHEPSTIATGNDYDLSAIYERQTSQESYNDHKARSTENVNLFADKLDILGSGGSSLDEISVDVGNGYHEILGKGNRDSLEFEWKVTNWTTCSQSCSFTGNAGGYQVRSTQCIVTVENMTRGVGSALCLDAGLGAPPTIQKCGFDECPRWQVDDWSECEKSTCFTLRYARQKRDIACIFHNGTEATFDYCDEVTKPHQEKECYNRLCIGVWQTGNWTKCIAPCDGQGYKTRLLKCVWNGTDKSGGNACRELARPEVVRWCDRPKCPNKKDKRGRNRTSSGSKCQDHSKYCKIVVRIDMCKHYRELCCYSCQ